MMIRFCMTKQPSYPEGGCQGEARHRLGFAIPLRRPLQWSPERPNELRRNRAPSGRGGCGRLSWNRLRGQKSRDSWPGKLVSVCDAP
jgi:hypothetical protein